LAEISFLKNPAEIYFWLCRISKNRGQKTFRPHRQKGSKISKKGQKLPRGLDASLVHEQDTQPSNFEALKGCLAQRSSKPTMD
jgi:hypothetical protein